MTVKTEIESGSDLFRTIARLARNELVSVHWVVEYRWSKTGTNGRQKFRTDWFIKFDYFWTFSAETFQILKRGDKFCFSMSGPNCEKRVPEWLEQGRKAEDFEVTILAEVRYPATKGRKR